MTLYSRRDPISLGEHYTRHVAAMTEEDLRAKSDIAAELAWRDTEIERLQGVVSGGLVAGVSNWRDVSNALAFAKWPPARIVQVRRAYFNRVAAGREGLFGAQSPGLYEDKSVDDLWVMARKGCAMWGYRSTVDAFAAIMVDLMETA